MKFLGHSRTIIGIEQRASGLTLLVLDPSHGPRQVAALGSSRDSLRLIRRNMTAMRAPQYQIVAVKGLFDTEEQYQVILSSSLYRTFSTLCTTYFKYYVVHRLYALHGLLRIWLSICDEHSIQVNVSIESYAEMERK